MPDFVQARLRWEPRLLSVVRIILGLLFLEHGLAKIADFPHQPTHHPYVLLTLVPGAQGIIEVAGGALLTLGLFTRPVAFILAGDMAAAYFIAHAPRGFFPLLNGGELAIVYCFVFLYFWLAGGGVWSLDWLFAPRQAHVSAIWREHTVESWASSEAARQRAGEPSPERARAGAPEYHDAGG
jgi:putative oxidoreductase